MIESQYKNCSFNEPPFITPFVLMADIERAVIDVTAVVVKISNMDCPGKEFFLVNLSLN